MKRDWLLWIIAVGGLFLMTLILGVALMHFAPGAFPRALHRLLDHPPVSGTQHERITSTASAALIGRCEQAAAAG